MTLCSQPFPINRNALPKSLIFKTKAVWERLWAGGDVHSWLLSVPAGTSLLVAPSPAACDTQHPLTAPPRHSPAQLVQELPQHAARHSL